jgi:hypothetical protein
MYQKLTKGGLKGLSFLLLLFIGSFSCSKKEQAQTSPALSATDSQISLLGNWIAGDFSNTKNRVADTASAVTTRSRMGASNWAFKQDGTLTVGDGASSATIGFISLPNNRLIFSLDGSADTLSVEKAGPDKIKLTGVRHSKESTLTEVLELYRTDK